MVNQGYIREQELRSLNPIEPLTDREKDVLALVAQGYTSYQAAQELSLSHRTVEGYRVDIKSKLGLAGRRQHLLALMHYAREMGLI